LEEQFEGVKAELRDLQTSANDKGKVESKIEELNHDLSEKAEKIKGTF
jgi:hypothetical protein